MSKIIMWLLLGVFVAAVAGCTPPQEGVSEDAVQGLILQFLDKIEWRTSDERRAFVKTHTNDFFGAVDPEKARAQGLVPLSAEDIETLRSAIAKASLTDAEKQSMAAELENDITNRSFTSIFGRVWKWLCNATGDKCSTDDGGSSVGGPRG